MFNFLIMNLILLVTAYLSVRYFFYFDSWADKLIAIFVIFLSFIILSLQLLGLAGALYFNNIIFLIAAFLLVVILCIRILKPVNIGVPIFKLKGALPVKVFSKILLLCLSLITGFVLVKVAVNLINPPFGWDSLNYHYTFAVEWLKNGNLDNPMVVSDDPFPSYYPINGSLLFFWLIMPFKSAYLADLAQLPFFVVAFLAVYSICKKLKLDSERSLLAACLYVCIPNFFKQLQIGYIDIMVGALFLVAVNSILALKEKFELKSLVVFALSFGILMGIKTTAVPYGFLIFLPFLYLILILKQRTLVNKFSLITLFFTIVFMFGSYAYLKNTILTGNPLYPLEAKLGGVTIFKGVIDKATFVSRNEAGGYSLNKLLFHEGLGIQSLLIILPATILAFPLNYIKNKKSDLFLHYFMLLPLFLYFFYYFVLPIPNSRYLYSMLGMGVVAGFYLLAVFKIPVKIIRIVSLAMVIVSLAECARHAELVFSLITGFLLFLIILLCLKLKKIRNIIFSMGTAVLLVLVAVFVFNWSFFNYKENEYQRYIKNSRYWPDATRAWAWLNEHTKGDNVAYVGKPIPYPLYGTDYKNNVYYVSVNPIDPIKLHFLKNSRYRWGRWSDDAVAMHKNFEERDNYRGGADYLIWLGNLRNRKTDFLFIYSLHHVKNIEFPFEEVWAKSHPQDFELVFFNDSVRIYKIKA